MASGRKPDDKATKSCSPWVKAFVAFHIFCVIVWSLPAVPEAVQKGQAAPFGSDWLLIWNERTFRQAPPIRTYMLVTGSWQYWDMFAPNPLMTDTFGTAELIYEDGSKKVYRYPRIADMPIPKKYFSERYRKFFERAHLEDFQYLWPDFAQRVALINARLDGKVPVRVRLSRHFKIIAAPGEPQGDYRQYMFYEHVVDQGRVREAMRSRA